MDWIHNRHDNNVFNYNTTRMVITTTKGSY